MDWALFLVKVVVIVIMILGVVGVGLLPILVPNGNQGYLSVLTAFSGGVLLGIVLLHLLPEVLDDGVQFKCTLELTTGYPIAEVLIALGFLLILLIETSVEEAKRGCVDQGEEQPLIGSRDKEEDGTYSATAQQDDAIRPANGASAVQEPRPPVYKSTTVGSYILVLALAVHSVMEGLAIGITQTISDTLTLFVAVIIHKLCLAFAVGMKLFQDQRGMAHQLTGLLVFALAAPIGVILGILITKVLDSTALDITMFVINALATGTFIYITFLEILGPEFQTRHINQLYKTTAVVIGFALMALVFLFTHNYGHPNCNNGGHDHNETLTAAVVHKGAAAVDIPDL